MSLARRLIAAGFSDLEKSERFLAAPELDGLDQDILFAGLQLAANPDTALQSLVRLIEKHHDLRRLAVADLDRSEPMYRVLGASEALGEFLIRHPEHLNAFDVKAGPEPREAETAVLRDRLLRSVRADPKSSRPVALVTGQEGYEALRTEYRRGLVELAVKDIRAADPLDFMPAAGAELADLAGAAIEAALAVSRAEAGEQFSAAEVADVGLAVIGMGKCGARELNYISDVDVIYVIESGSLDDSRANTIGTALAAGISRAIMSTGREPGLWEVDANLRPEGKSGPLVRTLASHESYYARWAESWEFQALLKARTIAGDTGLGARYEAAIAPLVWSSAGREGFVESVRSMRRRVTENIPAEEEQRQIKLGRGGLRDVEFTVQLLQLVHGKSDESLRCRDTTSAIAALSAGGYIGRSDAAEFDRAYRYLRLLEHRIQLFQLRRTHLMPVKEASLRALAKAMLGPFSSERPKPDALVAVWRKTKRSVRELHERIFYRPLLNTAAALSSEEARLSPEAAQGRLAALGYLDPRGAMRHIEALTGGVSRRAALQRQLLPILLGWLAEGVDPDAGLLAFRRVSEALGTTHWYLGMLRDSTAAAERLCHVLSNSRLIADLLEVSPESVAWLGSDKELVPLTFAAQWLEIASKMSRHAEPESAMRLIRLIRRREILRIAIADSAGLLDQDQVGAALADTDRAAVLGALRVAESVVAAGAPLKTDVLVVAMGRQGGREIGYGSDADVMYVHRGLPGVPEAEAQDQALQIVSRLSSLLTQPLKPAILAERVLLVDADLRPEGKSGPMVRSLESYAEYYRRWSLVWEAQALLRARPMAGNDVLAADFVALIDPVRYPELLSEQDAREVRRVKARVEAERLPRGADPARHLKLGRGGLSDVEWLAQLLQLQHAGKHPGLRTTSTVEALEEAAAVGLLEAGDVVILLRAWRLASRIRSANVVWTGRASDVLPSSRRDLEAVARWCGYGQGNAAALEEDYLRLSRRARGVFERVFYGQ
ncbi:bifunctional [glutamine synthetase] adenylyltransferase/[glutamine synthetase]-adenylyl-L-tyrosine phosphorylase [Arthrobacter sp. AL08]|uniref:bifunctional [glutamine synthetase] adenylyltransferase/[glutamine synthetase]-adenylyl-L-tyrosine phosphorylase n=1 Tax=unclassified Arthrobacter TaxID=235627 RepID=UPI00249CDAEB|nr:MULTISPECIES: bifunctional [glutamine synthetase] adenylyltransferase/[glutamine synthetase]-adenylyl-L-tyrosine phosphorylase [unclassified Arthrobacter]MDI3241656.1 bifunctional [glutamine synthetase] adenylyltransferase/[glutamine synthetase]-adenylyl-L-tyrosine phosphorylase [Arthrobacter sp. AL05]MDI3277666.1 bifunctional [glutamine synthetase] adenylyltransferase/[glutamine synthetase]-adenylyl-L-tyrosine phosphorylase [Arthrobacter sp. AL08]